MSVAVMKKLQKIILFAVVTLVIAGQEARAEVERDGPNDTPHAATLDDLKQRAASRHAYATEHYINESGGPTPVEEATLRNTAARNTFGELANKSFDTVNAAISIAYKMEQLGIAPDPTFDVSDHWDDLIKTVPTEYMGEFINVRSATEMAFVQERILKKLENKAILEAAGYRGVLAQALSFIFDVYAVLALFVAITLFPIVRFIAGLVTASIKGVVSIVQNVMASGLSSAVQVGGDQPNVVAAGARGMDDKHETVFDQSGNVSQEAIGSAHIGFFGDMKRLLSFDLAWSERTVLEKAYTGLFVLIVIALFPMPYGFYSSLRVMVCIGLYFYFQAILPERANRPVWFWVIVVLFVIYNPVIPVRIEEKVAWFLINFGTIYALYRARLVFDR